MYKRQLQNSELFASNPAQLPNSVEALPAAMDKTGWAVVNNPNPADRLHLRVSPERGATSLGKFYNGTPVQVLEEDVYKRQPSTVRRATSWWTPP